MRIERHRSRLNFRARPRRRFGLRTGCVPLALLLGLLVGLGVTSLNWLGLRLSIGSAPNAEADLRNAQQAFSRGDLDTAVDLAQRVWAAQPERADSLALLVRALIYRSYVDYDRAVDREIALDLTTSAFNRFRSNLDIMAVHAFALQANGQPVIAAQMAEYVLNRAPGHTLAQIALGLAYGSVGGYEAALRVLQNAPENDDWSLDLQRALAITYADLGRYDEALVISGRAIALNTRLLTLYFERAQYARQIGDLDSATADYFRVLAFDPDNIKARLRLCEVSTLLRERETAVHYCSEVTAMAPGWVDGWYQLGYEFFLQGDFAAAQASFNRCTTLQVMQNIPVQQRRFECWYLQGQAAEIRGDCPGLLRIYEEFQTMAAQSIFPQSWTYPPEGPAICSGPP